MSDNVGYTPGTGATVAADDIGGVLYQRNKLAIGADGSATDAVGGAGAVAAGVLRTTLASDDPAVVSLDSILAKIIAAPATEAKQDVIIATVAAPATGTKSNVSAAAASTSILASNANRRGAVFYNDSTAILYLDLSGGTASLTSFSIAMGGGGYFELPDGKHGVYTGAITGIWASATGAVRVTEFT